MATQLPLLDLGDPRLAPHRHKRVAAARVAAARGAEARVAEAPPASSAAGNGEYWRLDDRTRELGLKGVEEARRALAAAVERTGVRTAA